MADPITWRTVSGPSIADAARPLAYASQTINDGFGSLKDALKERQLADEAAWRKQDASATQDVLGKIYQAQNVNDFNALNTSGALDQAVAANGARIDRAAVNALRDGRVNTLQQREKQGWEFQDATTDRAQLPIVQSILTEAAQGNRTKAMEIMAKNPDLRLPAPLMDSIVKGDRDFQKWGFTVAEEKQKEAMRPLDLAGKRLSNAGQATSNETGVLNLKKVKMELGDMEEVRKLDNTIASAQQKYAADRAVVGKNMGVMAKTLGLPVTSAGMPDFDNMTKDQIASYDNAAKSNKTVTLPSARDFMSGDTIAANNFVTGLSDSGQFRASTLKKFNDQIRAGFNTNANSSLVGNDAANKALSDAQSKVAFDEKDANNWYAPGSPNAVRSYEGIATKIDGMFGDHEKEDLPHVQKLLTRMANEGLTIKGPNGKDMQVVPSQNDILAAVRSTYEGWNIRNKGRAEDIEKELKKTLQTASATKRLADGEESAAYRRKEAVKAILNPSK